MDVAEFSSERSPTLAVRFKVHLVVSARSVVLAVEGKARVDALEAVRSGDSILVVEFIVVVITVILVVTLIVVVVIIEIFKRVHVSRRFNPFEPRGPSVLVGVPLARRVEPRGTGAFDVKGGGRKVVAPGLRVTVARRDLAGREVVVGAIVVARTASHRTVERVFAFLTVFAWRGRSR